MIGCEVKLKLNLEKRVLGFISSPRASEMFSWYRYSTYFGFTNIWLVSLEKWQIVNFDIVLRKLEANFRTEFSRKRGSERMKFYCTLFTCSFIWNHFRLVELSSVKRTFGSQIFKRFKKNPWKRLQNKIHPWSANFQSCSLQNRSTLSQNQVHTRSSFRSRFLKHHWTLSQNRTHTRSASFQF